jgi:hypothetical protein
MWAWRLLNGECPDRRDPEVESGLMTWLIGDRDDELGLPPWSSQEGQRLRDAAGL